MSDRFCYLQKDQKTFDILKKYMDDINSGVDIWCEDQRIQVKEIITHNQLNNVDDTLNWPAKYGAGERMYLSTIKQLAFLFYCTSAEVTWESFCTFIDKVNLAKNPILEKIF